MILILFHFHECFLFSSKKCDGMISFMRLWTFQMRYFCKCVTVKTNKYCIKIAKQHHSEESCGLFYSRKRFDKCILLFFFLFFLAWECSSISFLCKVNIIVLLTCWFGIGSCINSRSAVLASRAIGPRATTTDHDSIQGQYRISKCAKLLLNNQNSPNGWFIWPVSMTGSS